MTFTPIVSDYKGTTSCFHNVESKFYCTTDIGAKEGRIVIIDFMSPKEENWIEIMPENN